MKRKTKNLDQNASFRDLDNGYLHRFAAAAACWVHKFYSRADQSRSAAVPHWVRWKCETFTLLQMTKNVLIANLIEISPWVESVDRLWTAHHVSWATHWMSLTVKRRSRWTHEGRTAANKVIRTTRTELRSKCGTWTSRSSELWTVTRRWSKGTAASRSIVRRPGGVLRWWWKARWCRWARAGRRWAWWCGRCRILRCIWAGRWTLKAVRLHVASRRSLIRLRKHRTSAEVVGTVRSAAKVVASVLRIGTLPVAFPVVPRLIHAQWRSGRHATARNTYKTQHWLQHRHGSDWIRPSTHLTCFQNSEFLLFLCASH